MDIKNEFVYFFSTERASPSLPTRLRYVRRLNVTGGDINREVVLVELEQFDEKYPHHCLAIFPRHTQQAFFGQSNDDPIFVNVLDGSPFIRKDAVDLSDPEIPFVDIGGVSTSREQALLWQCKSQE